MTRLPALLTLAALLLTVAVALMYTGLYGWTLFFTIPVTTGAAAAWGLRARTFAEAVKFGAIANAVASAFFIFAGVEGLICTVMALPLTVGLGVLGGWLAWSAARGSERSRHAAMLLLLPSGAGSLGWDLTATPPVFEVRTAIEIVAPPQRVWDLVVAFPEIAPPTEWYFRAGLAHPVRARIDGTGPGAMRHCELSTGPVLEPIEVWEEPRRLEFRVVESPAPMVELSPWRDVNPKHLHGYFESERGRFQLTPLAGGGTRLEGTTWYRHGLWPAAYWRLWSDAVVHRIHWRVLRHIRELAEAAKQPGQTP